MSYRPADDGSTVHGMGTHCSSCGEPFLPGASFCGSCGAARTAPTRTPEEAQQAPGAPARRQRGIAIATVITLALVGGVAGAILWTSQRTTAPSTLTTS